MILDCAEFSIEYEETECKVEDEDIAAIFTGILVNEIAHWDFFSVLINRYA